MGDTHPADSKFKEFIIESPPVWIPEAIRYGEDARSGAEVEQLTSEPVTSTNIYCEQRYASADGKRIAIQRAPFGGPVELWVCDLMSLRLCRIGPGSPVSANPLRNAIYFITPPDDGVARLMRLDLVELATRELRCFDDGPPPRVCAVSPDERWLVGGPYPGEDNVFRLRRTDLQTGRTDTLCAIEDMFNPHLQFDPADGRHLVVQVNRGGRGKRSDVHRTMVGRLGATLCLVHVESGQVHPLPVGRPHTPGLSGHECWAGSTGRLLFTAAQYKVSPSAHVTLREPPDVPDEERGMPPAAVYSVALGDSAARIVAEGLLFNHLAASDDGRFFIADDHATGRIHVGSLATGRYLPLCDSHTRQGTCQHSHVHAYMTPDNAHVIFNSISTGCAQVYAARVPDEFLADVLNA